MESIKRRNSSEPNTYNKRSRVSPLSFAFRLDHVLEEIFHFLDVNDLLNSRFQCLRWNYFATSRLQKLKWFELTFLNSKRTSRKPLEKLTSLLQTPTLSEDPLPAFPCSHYDFTHAATDLIYVDGVSTLPLNAGNDVSLYNFFSTQRVQIRHLCLDIYGGENMEEDFIIEKLNQLLSTQYSNLRCFWLDGPDDLKITWKNGGDSRPSLSPLKSTDPEFHEIKSKYGSTKFIKLKELQIVSKSAKILEMLIQSSPNLEQVRLPTKYYKYLLEPINRLYLLKYLELDGANLPLRDLERIAHACIEGKLKLKILKLYFTNISELNWRIVWVLNRFLECSWDSLEELEWIGVTFLDGIKFPKMTKLEAIMLRYPFDINGKNVFQRKASFPETFPKLRSLTCFNMEDMEILEELVYNLITEPVKSIAWFSVHLDSRQRFTEKQMEKLKQLFPCANITDRLRT